MVFFTSDLHFGHDREFIYKSRGFDSVEEMNESLIFNWNELIDPEDEIYVLGDLMMNDISKGAECWKRLKGKKYVILGNHDSNARIRLYRELPNTEISGYALPYRYKKYDFFLSHYPTITYNYDTDEPLSVQVIDLCGHTHTRDRFSDMDKGLIYHVEVDAHDNRPVSIDSIINDIRHYRGVEK